MRNKRFFTWLIISYLKSYNKILIYSFISLKDLRLTNNPWCNCKCMYIIHMLINEVKAIYIKEGKMSHNSYYVGVNSPRSVMICRHNYNLRKIFILSLHILRFWIQILDFSVLNIYTLKTMWLLLPLNC